MLNKLIDSISVRISGLKKFDIHLKDFFPLKEHDFKEYKGKYISKQDKFSFITLTENMKRINFNGEDSILQNRTFIDDSGTIIFLDDIVFGYHDEVVFEYSRTRNRSQTVYPEPMAYLDIYNKGKYPNGVFVFKSFQEFSMNGKVSLCLLVTKKFYSGLWLQRIERLYLVEGKGMVKYEEESFYPNKFNISYELSQNDSGYKMISHDSLGYFLYNPNSNQLSGSISCASNHSVTLLIETEGELNDRIFERSGAMIEKFVDLEKILKQQIAEEFLNTYNDSWNEGDDITSIDFAELIRLNTIFVIKDGEIEAYFDTGELFDGHAIIATFDEEMNLDSVDIINW
ncbi:DUF2262 domain-containing protein [Bacillus sp. RG28]|uniref:DUF2262 domain-containing protein n=1 Tax=Gottfriedia endophytica TaxID=2820819 RepID=A0A940NPC9_9BACI|nr:DUF2262 domain-containing protein [Gottfriedia endophytica]MBP0725864.1 DUF2262 domain-containing protein [Gottfriedia endophytica]